MNQGGRPRVYDTPEELEEAVKDYLRPENRPFTMTGLALHLGFCSRQSLYDYDEDERFSYIIKRARLAVENGYEQRLMDTEASPTGAIFALKNMGWRDKHEVENSGEMGINWNITKTYGSNSKADDSA